MPHMRVRQMLWCTAIRIYDVQPNTLTSFMNQLYANLMSPLPWEMPRVAIYPFDMPPNQMGPTVWSHLNLGLCWWMFSTFDTAHIVTALKYGWARELLWNSNLTYSIFALSNELLESKRMACVKQGECWYLCEKHMQTFWHCRLKMQGWKGGTALYC